MAEQIKVEWITSQQQVIQALEKLNRKIDDTGKASVRAGRESQRGADAAVNSFKALEKELKDNERELKKLTMGSKAFAAQKAKVDQLRASYAAAKKGLQGHNQEVGRMSGFANSAIVKIGGMVAGLGLLAKTVEAIVAELEKADRLKLKAAGTERTLEQSLADIGMNIGGENLDKARTMIRDRAPELGVDQKGLANLLGTAISAGAKDLEQAMDVSAAALKLTVGDAQKAETLVGGALDIASLNKSGNFEGALGQIQQTQAQVRSTNPAEFARNIGPALAAAAAEGNNQKGMTTEQSLELSAVVSQILKDQTGSNTATAVRQFVTRMDSFAPKLEATLKDGSKAKLTKEQIEQFQKTDTFEGRVEMMRQVPALAAQFVDRQEDGIGKVAIREIVTGSKTARDLETKARTAITSIDQAQGKFKALADPLERHSRVLKADRQAQANLERMETSGQAAVDGQALKIFNETLENVDLPGVDYAVRPALKAELELRSLVGEETKAEDAQRLLEKLALKHRDNFSEEHKELLRRNIEAIEKLRQQGEKPNLIKVNLQAPPGVNPVPAAQVP